MSHAKLPADVVGYALEFLSAVDLATYSTVTSFCRRETLVVFIHRWLSLNSACWGVKLGVGALLGGKDLQKMSDAELGQSLRRLRCQFPLNRPLGCALGRGLVSHTQRPEGPIGEGLVLSDHACAFIGSVGQGNRAVQSSVAFPAFPSEPPAEPKAADLSLKTAAGLSLKTAALSALVHASIALARFRMLSFIRTHGRRRGRGALRADVNPRAQQVQTLGEAVAVALLPLLEAISSAISPAANASLPQPAPADSTLVPAPEPIPALLFVAPLRDRCGRFLLAPRSVAYFEVAIERLPAVARALQPFPPPEEEQHECVAVGLAVGEYTSTQRLPGWDLQSYGYHGDDGAIFHGHGRQLKSYGSRFGPGDTVGCGRDYRSGTIFFTLNGTNLGVAFTDVDPQVELAPIVGLDSNAQVTFNFGLTRPFAFDLVQVLWG